MIGSCLDREPAIAPGGGRDLIEKFFVHLKSIGIVGLYIPYHESQPSGLYIAENMGTAIEIVDQHKYILCRCEGDRMAQQIVQKTVRIRILQKSYDTSYGAAFFRIRYDMSYRCDDGCQIGTVFSGAQDILNKLRYS